MKKVLAFIIGAITVYAGFASATMTAPSPHDIVRPNWYTQTGYFVPAETIQPAAHDYIVTDDGNTWAVDIDLPEGPCAVIFDNHGDRILENDSVVMICPLEVARNG